MLDVRGIRLKSLYITNPVAPTSKYYRICSNNLMDFGFSQGEALRSNTIAIVPFDHSKTYTNYENNDDFFLESRRNEISLSDSVYITIHLDEDSSEISFPEFTLVFQIIE